jgi:hypothetical protein
MGRRIRVLDAVGEAIGSEVQVRDLMAELRQTVFQTAAQMRIDATEASFSPSEGCKGTGQAEQGTNPS